MCILTYLPSGILPNRERLLEGTCSNPDGYGYAVVVGDRIEVGKGMDATAVLDAFIRVRTAHPDGPALFHSRITTDGLTDESNCHPFIVAGDARTVLAHNGILPLRPDRGDDRSDTRCFAEDFGDYLYPPQLSAGRFIGGEFNLNSKRGRKRLRTWLTTGNKVLVLTVDPTFRQQAFLINEEQGIWEDDGCWYSNRSYESWGTRYPSLSKYSWDGWGKDDDKIVSKLLRKAGKKGDESVDCEFCHSLNTVDAQLTFCSACGTCQDCHGDAYSYGQSWSCSCYWPKGTRLADSDSNRTDTGTGYVYDEARNVYKPAPRELTSSPSDNDGPQVANDNDGAPVTLGPAHSPRCVIDYGASDCPRCAMVRPVTLGPPSAES